MNPDGATPPPRLMPPPTPLPTQWARAIANSITSELRRGWRHNRAVRPYHTPRSRDYHTPGSINTPEPTSELLWNEPYIRALLEPDPLIGMPYIAWELLKTDHDQALHGTTCEPAFTAYLHHRPQAGRPAAPYIAKPNRHGNTAYRRNAEHAPPDAHTALTLLVSAATIWLPDPRDVQDHYAENDQITPNLEVEEVDDELGGVFFRVLHS